MSGSNTIIFETVAKIDGFPEGPVAMDDGSVIFVDIKQQTLSRVKSGQRPELLARLPGGPNGVAIGPDGAAYVCNNGGVYSFSSSDGATVPGPAPNGFSGGWIERVDLKTGCVTRLYEVCGDRKLLAPNDLVFDRDGGFWFTDTGYQDKTLIHKGGVYYAKIDGSFITRKADIQTPNGIGLSPDGQTVYVADTVFGRLWALDLQNSNDLKPGPSQVMPGRVIATLPHFQWVDSLKVEASGKICVGTIFSGCISVFSLDGTVEQVAVNDMFTTNLCFGGADMRDVYVTASSKGHLLKGRWPRAGLKLAFHA